MYAFTTYWRAQPFTDLDKYANSMFTGTSKTSHFTCVRVEHLLHVLIWRGVVYQAWPYAVV
jgi:hypothetical protein